MRLGTLFTAGMAAGVLILSCVGAAPKPPGREGAACRSNGKCAPGLTCLSQLCVNAGTTSAAAIRAPAADAPGTETQRCAPTQVTCDGRRVDTRSDPAHCGGCGNTCTAPKTRCQCSECIRPPAVGRTFRIVELEGTGYQRGVKHGTELRGAIHSVVALWKDDLKANYNTEPGAFIKDFVARTDYVSSIKKWTPELLEEVRGIADGAGIDFPTMLTFQLVDEYWVNGGEIAKEHCSGLGIAATPDHPAVVAQNMDLEGFRDGFQALLHIREPSGLEAYVLTTPGMIALNGINSHGIGITANTLAQLAHNRDGLPVAFVLRGVLQRQTFAEAESFLKEVRHASGQNYVVGGSGRVAFFEASAHKVVEVASSHGFIYHTNHPLANDDYDPDGDKWMHEPHFADDSPTRYEAVRRRLAADPGGSVVKLIQETLRSRDSSLYPVCRWWQDKSKPHTYASTILVLAADQPYLIATPGPPDQYEYAAFRFGRAAGAK